MRHGVPPVVGPPMLPASRQEAVAERAASRSHRLLPGSAKAGRQDEVSFASRDD
jgi:hypothetical protein